MSFATRRRLPLGLSLRLKGRRRKLGNVRVELVEACLAEDDGFGLHFVHGHPLPRSFAPSPGFRAGEADSVSIEHAELDLARAARRNGVALAGTGLPFGGACFVRCLTILRGLRSAFRAFLFNLAIRRQRLRHRLLCGPSRWLLGNLRYHRLRNSCLDQARWHLGFGLRSYELLFATGWRRLGVLCRSRVVCPGLRRLSRLRLLCLRNARSPLPRSLRRCPLDTPPLALLGMPCLSGLRGLVAGIFGLKYVPLFLPIVRLQAQDIRKRLGACQLKTESQIAVGEADHLSIQHRGSAPCGLEKIKCLGHWGRSHHFSLRVAMHQRGLHASGGGAGVAFIARWSVLLGSVGPSRLEGKQKLKGAGGRRRTGPFCSELA